MREYFHSKAAQTSSTKISHELDITYQANIRHEQHTPKVPIDQNSRLRFDLISKMHLISYSAKLM